MTRTLETLFRYKLGRRAAPRLHRRSAHDRQEMGEPPKGARVSCREWRRRESNPRKIPLAALPQLLPHKIQFDAGQNRTVASG